MNERIKQLATQAGILKEQSVQAKIVKNEDGSWTSILEYPDLAKFAELIIKECANAIVNDSRLSDVRTARNGCVRTIKEHFGVEE
jgi:hypothetical protein